MGLSVRHFFKTIGTICFLPLFVGAYECDTGELRRVEPKEMTQISLKKFKSEASKLNANQSQNLEQLMQLKKKYKLNVAADYIFDKPEANTYTENFTTLFEQGTKTFFLNQGRLIAVLDQINSREFLLTRLNVNCQPFEMVSFSSLETQTSLPIRYIITPQYCRRFYESKSQLEKNATEAALSYIADARDPLTRKGLHRDCQFLKQSPAALMKKKGPTLAHLE